ncbi:alpha/beta fold hydrolase [Janthinobacterium sp. GW460P]|uniref:YheT family hydrolase n=1 Tax=unclassified Janthinobacterium TaxID=2610881 RepID=UPI000A3293F9|nr:MULTISPECIES: alpha/beta fold hydrolase [unclassified Janthinobacterium]MCC7702342.1 alpha/beta fold hydrolase [Janthinobacterium sp. GW460P]MCC7707850.1 alpha/beta fold hydrolase [Janthinobacterium sp. GW460W]
MSLPLIYNASYTAPLWLPGGHAQTIYPAVCLAKPAVPFRRERWQAPDGDFVDVDLVDGQPGQPFVVLFHGLEGSSDSHYARALMAEVAARGWSGAVPHFRGCSGEANLAPRFYHSGDAQEVDWIVRRLRPRATGKFYAAGVSLGGNALLCWLGQSQHQADFIDAATAVSAPLDLAQGGKALSSGANRFYTRMFLNTLKPKCLAKLEQFPGLFARDAMLAARDLHAFDNVVTAPLHGYRDADDYWHRASAKHVLPDITVPTLVLNAQNDPFLPGRFLPRSAAPTVTLEYPRHGGHVGFAAGKLPGRTRWLPQRLIHFFEGGNMAPPAPQSCHAGSSQTHMENATHG